VTLAAKSARRIAAGEMIAIVLALITACSGHAQPPAPATTTAPEPKSATPSARPTTSDPSPPAAAVGIAGRYRVGERQLTFVEPPHTGPTGEHLGQRRLATTVWYPLAGSRPAAGPLPLLMFAPGFMMCSGPYSSLLETWASAGYVVAAVNFPRTNCHLGAAAYEPDLVNQPRDVSYALTRLLALSAEPNDLFSGLIDRQEVGAAGQSDGGDTVAALAANGCCTDHRLAAVAVLSGAEWPPMPGRYFAHGAPPMLFAQGSADTINPPGTSVLLYETDQTRARYYLDLLGADHLIPYTGANPVERLVARVTLAFFNRYALGQANALATMTREGNVSGAAVLVNGGEPPP
jgi:fermentation-respiration switch protein FrsA (DUF1100 family)